MNKNRTLEIEAEIGRMIVFSAVKSYRVSLLIGL